MPHISTLDNGRYHITLTPEEFHRATAAGQQRHADSRNKGLTSRGCPCSAASDIEGCAAELAVGLLLGQTDFSPSVGSFHDADLHLPNDRSLQVRSTDRADGGLVWRDGDSLDDTYVLVTGSGVEWTVQGWCRGKYARDFGYDFAGDRSEGCRILPQSRLMRMGDLRWLSGFLPAHPDDEWD